MNASSENYSRAIVKESLFCHPSQEQTGDVLGFLSNVIYTATFCKNKKVSETEVQSMLGLFWTNVHCSINFFK